MKAVRTLVICLSLIIAGVLFNTGSAYAADGSKGGDTTCTTQLNPHGNPIIRCTVLGNDKNDNGAVPTPTKHSHRHHHFHHRFYHCWHRHHYRHVYHCHHSYHRHR